MFNYPLRRTRPGTRQKDTDYQMRQERRKPQLPGPYVYVGVWVDVDSPSNDPPVTTWQSPPWENSFTWFDTDYVGFRHGLDGWTEFIGKLDLTQGAVTGTKAFTLPVPWRAISFDYTFPIFIGGNDWQNGVLAVNQDGVGGCYVYWPVTV